MRKAWLWLKNNWQVPLVALGAVLAFAAGGFAVRKLRRPDKTIRRELAAAKAGTETAAQAVEHGAETAVKALEKQHATTIEAFDDQQKAKLERMRTDPAAAARWLNRLSSD